MSVRVPRGAPWLALALGALNVLLVQLIVQQALGLDLLGAVAWLLLPVGTLLGSGAAMAGFVWVARQRAYRADRWDLVLLAAVGLALPGLALGVQHAWIFWDVPAAWTWAQFKGHAVLAIEGAQSFVWIPEHGFYASALGSLGWAVLVPKLATALAVAKIAHSASGGGSDFPGRDGFTAPR